MADLCAGAVGAVEQTAFHNDAAADTGAQSGEYHILAALTAALPEFTHGSYVGVIACLYREAGEGMQFVRNIEDTPAQIDALVHNTLAVDRTGNTDAQTQNLCAINALCLQIAQNRCCDIGQDLLAGAFRDGGDFPLVQHGAVFVEVCDLDGGTAEVNAKAVFHKDTSQYFS